VAPVKRPRQVDLQKLLGCRPEIGVGIVAGAQQPGRGHKIAALHIADRMIERDLPTEPE